MEVTRLFARYLVASRYTDLPTAVVHEAQRALLNGLGCAIGSSRDDTVNNAVAATQPFFGPPQAQILGRSERADVLHAALINGISLHVLDFDDTHERCVHPSAPVWPALLALAEHMPVRGEDLLHAFVLGVEAECRIGLSVFPEHYDRGWHITGTAGVFGAAAAAGKLLGLNDQQMTWALGIAATQSSGLREMFGSMCKSLHPGRAAQSGLYAALLAQRNYTSSDFGIEGKRGFAHTASTKFDPDIITEGLGEHYELSRNMYKPFACGLVVHAALDACMQLKRENQLSGLEIAAVTVYVNPVVMELTVIRNPRTGLEGKFSIFHAAAVALVRGAAGESEFSTEAVLDPAVSTLRDAVQAVPDANLHKLESRVTVTLKDGRVIDKHVLRALGSRERPMSDVDLEDKFSGLVAGVLPKQQAADIMKLCWSAADLDDTSVIARSCAAAPIASSSLKKASA